MSELLPLGPRKEPVVDNSVKDWYSNDLAGPSNGETYMTLVGLVSAAARTVLRIAEFAMISAVRLGRWLWDRAHF